MAGEISERPVHERSPAEREQALADFFSAIAAAPREHDFFAVLRRTEALRPEQPRLGRALRPSQEALRLGQEPELDFAPAALDRFDAREGGAPRLGVRFFGLLGPQGPMPLHFTEYVRERLRTRGDATLARFLDIFHHRLLSLFYRSWADAHPVTQLDRPDDDRYARWLGAGFGAETTVPGRAVPPSAALFQAGLLGGRSRHGEGLAKLLREYFRMPVRVVPYVAHWLALDAADQTRLGYARNRAEKATVPARALGVSATCGHKRRDRQYKFRVAFGPLSLAQYESLLPPGRAWRGVIEWVQRYVGLGTRFDVQLVLAQAELPPARLDRSLRVGVTAWLGRRGHRGDGRELHLRPDTCYLLRPGVPHA